MPDDPSNADLQRQITGLVGDVGDVRSSLRGLRGELLTDLRDVVRGHETLNAERFKAVAERFDRNEKAAEQRSNGRLVIWGAIVGAIVSPVISAFLAYMVVKGH